MTDFLESIRSSPSPSDMATRKEAVMSAVKNGINQANAQELMDKLTRACFLKCVTKPSTSLSSSEETCLQSCMDRYLETFNIVSKTYFARVSRERSEARDSIL